MSAGVAALNVILELGFAGGGHHPLWGLVAIALDVFILYAVVVHWRGADAA